MFVFVAAEFTFLGFRLIKKLKVQIVPEEPQRPEGRFRPVHLITFSSCVVRPSFADAVVRLLFAVVKITYGVMMMID